MSQAGEIDVIKNHPEIPTMFPTNMGTAIPMANTLEILGVNSIFTTGVGDVVSIEIQNQIAYAPICGGTTPTGALQYATTGFANPGYILTSNGSAALPSWQQNSASESFNMQTGTSPVVPLAGVITFDGALVAAGTNPVQTDGTGPNTMTLEVQTAQAIASTNAANVGLAAFNSADFTVDANGFVSAVGNLPYISLTPYIVGSDIHSGYSTITAALAAAPPNSIVYVKAGAYIEDLAVTKNVTLVGFGSVGQTVFVGAAEIIGQMTVGPGLSVALNGFDIRNDNVNASFNITDSSILLCQNCVFTPGSTSTFLMNSALGEISIENCETNLPGNTGSLFDITLGTMYIKNCAFTKGTEATASTIATGTVYISNSIINFPITTSSVGVINASNVQFGTFFGSFINQTYITTAGTGTNYFYGCTFDSGSSSCVSIGAGTTATMVHCDFNSFAVNAITGAGTLQYGLLTFSGLSSGQNVTTVTPLPTLL